MRRWPTQTPKHKRRKNILIPKKKVRLQSERPRLKAHHNGVDFIILTREEYDAYIENYEI